MAAQRPGRVRARRFPPHGYLRARYWRVRQRRGHQRAVIAVAHAMLEIAYQMLTTGELYRDLGEDFYERRDQQHAKNRHLRALERLGYRVSLQPAQRPKWRSRRSGRVIYRPALAGWE